MPGAERPRANSHWARSLRPPESLLHAPPCLAGVGTGTSWSIKPREPDLRNRWRLFLLPRGFNEANQASSTCRLRLKPAVETSTPPFLGGGEGDTSWRRMQAEAGEHARGKAEGVAFPFCTQCGRRVGCGAMSSPRLLSMLLAAMAFCGSSTLVWGQGVPAREAREWKTTEGRAFQAVFVKLDGTQVTVRLANGQMATIPLLRLSLSDQVYIKGVVPPVAPTPGPNPASPLPPGNAGRAMKAGQKRLPVEKRLWPQKVEVDSRSIEVTAVSDKPAEKQYVYRSKNFHFISEDKLAGSVMKEIARTFEATHSLVEALPWGIEPQPPQPLGYYQAHFYVTRDSYIAAGGPPNSGGVYFSGDRMFRIPFPSLGLVMRGKTWFKDDHYRNDTIVHEITHQMMHDFLPFLPLWVIEGTAEYADMLPYNAGRFLTGSHERGIKEYIKEMEQRGVRLSDLGNPRDHMTMTAAQWHGGTMGTQAQLYYRSAILVYYFSHLDGDGKGTRFLKYLEKMAEARDAWETFFKDPRVEYLKDGAYRYPIGMMTPPQSRTEAYGLEQLDLLLAGRDGAKLQEEIVNAFKKIGVR